MAVVATGKPARTHFAVLERFGVATLLRCRLETGRTHQIRVHLASLGHPLVGDPAYGRKGPVPFPRQALHAARLALVHPVTGARLRVGVAAAAGFPGTPDRVADARRTVTGTAATVLASRLAAAGLDWIVPAWPAPAAVGALATTRRGGVSAGPYAAMNLGRSGRDDASALAENRRRLTAFLPSPPVWLDQVHGTAVATLTRESAAMPAPVADAAVTRDRGVVCAILTADCLPVLFADGRGTAVGIAHAGWRGLAAGVLEATIAALCDLGVRPDDVLAWLGPAIGPARFEVGADVRDAFCTSDAALRTTVSRRTRLANGMPISTVSPGGGSRAAA